MLPVRPLIPLLLAALPLAVLAACKDGEGEPAVTPAAATATAQAAAVAAVDPANLEVDTGKAIIGGVEYTFNIITCDVSESGRYQMEGHGEGPDGERVIGIAFGDVEGPAYQVEVRIFGRSAGQQPDNDYFVGIRTAEPLPYSSTEINELDPEGLTYRLSGTFYDGITGAKEVPGAFGVNCDLES
jgi:hypothetical protein